MSATFASVAPARVIGHVQCLRWDSAAARWWWGDSATGLLRTWSHDSEDTLQHPLPDEAGAFAQCSSGRLLLCQPKRLCIGSAPTAPGGRVQHGWRLRALAAVDAAEPRTSVNDGRTDRQGYFVFGTRNDGVDARPIGSFYQYSRQFGLRRLALPAVTAATSICFSTDGRTMYFADGAQTCILRCDYDGETAAVTNVCIFAEAGASPQGAVIDRDGNLWSAQAGVGRLVRYAPDGGIMQEFALPCGTHASPAFGGVALDELMVASADGLIRIPHTGAAGVPDARFDDR